MKKYVQSIAALTVICLVMSALLALTNHITAPIIEKNQAAAANEAYAVYGMRGLVYGDTVPEAKTVLSDGDAHYHVRHGAHYLSREDWNDYMDFIDRYVK